ncbi:hypothetical protein FO519_006031 [Halicephalobus sp. NKZ332]|nr:hypothetical protein FO519_006031 [Halicephalobus sp. NKZ332]
MTVIEKKFSRVVNGEHVDVMEIEPFQRNAPEYKCCCQKIHYTKGAFLVALLTILISVIGIIANSRIFYAIGIVVLLVFIVIGSWFTWVIYKAYNFLRDMHIARNPNRYFLELKTHHGIDEIQKTPKLPRAADVNGEQY